MILLVRWQWVATFLYIFCLGDVSGNPPLVNFGPSSIFWPEDTPIGTTLLNITATVYDGAIPSFSASNPENQQPVKIGTAFSVGTGVWMVNVTLNEILDRDRNPSSRNLAFTVLSGSSTIQGRVNLLIIDVNDNPPAFLHLPYRIELDEGSDKINQTVLQANATDVDDGPRGDVVFYMTADAQGADQIYNETFQINQVTGNIILTTKLDYEERNYYQFRITIKDRGNPQCPGPDCLCSNISEPNVDCRGETTLFTVIVQDVQDTPPFFERLPYIRSVFENETVGTSIYEVSALDGDRGVPNKVFYSIVNESQYPFTINDSTGILKVAKRGLDADSPNGRTSYTLTLMATEDDTSGSSQTGQTNTSTTISIAVIDVNDNAPQFNQDLYHATVPENAPRGVPLTVSTTIEVKDLDQSENNRFTLSVENEDGDLYDVFTTLPANSAVVQGTTTVMISVNNSSVLDYETIKNITFKLRALENGTAERYSNITTIVLAIEDQNDNSPDFKLNGISTVNVTEHAPNGTILTTFHATDADSGSYGKVSYSLEEPSAIFSIELESGNLTVTGDIDREAPGGTSYALVVVATDNMDGDQNERRSTRHNVRVTVIDINDNAPEFQIHPDSVTVQENAVVGTVLMTLTATDRDEGENSRIVYSILSVQSSHAQVDHLFRINTTTGVVSVNSSLMDFPGDHNLTIVAFDSADEPKNDTTSLLVNVRDVNNHAPVFVVPDGNLFNASVSSLPNVTVIEEEKEGSFILQLNAYDNDTGDNGLVYYYLDPDLLGHFTYFQVDFSSGNLTNKLRLDRERNDEFQINLKAEDRGSPTPLYTIIVLRVILTDINDNEPRFMKDAPLPPLTVGEETESAHVGFLNISIDDDKDPVNQIACYYIFGGQVSSSFSLNKITAELRLVSKLDRDVTPKVDLYVKVSGNCSLPEDHFLAQGNNSYNESDNTQLLVEIEVVDINDNPPVFDRAALTVGLLYDKEIGFEVINLVHYTTDEDTPANSQNHFRLLDYRPLETSPPFGVSLNGSVFTQRLFRSDEKEIFVLTVETFDSDNQTDKADVTIYLVSEIQRLKLVFSLEPNAVEKIKGDLVRRLSEVLGMTVIADKIATHITRDEKADPTRTDMFIHARRIPSGEIVPVSELLEALDYDLEIRNIFQDYGVVETQTLIPIEADDNKQEVTKAFIIVAIVLGIVCLVLILVLINTIRRYRRRLRAATTSAFVSKQSEPTNYIPPGTNKYYAAENPLYGKDVKPIDIGRSGDSDSLDDNAVGVKTSENREPEEEQEIYMQLHDDGPHSGMHVNHLDMVLKEYHNEHDGGEGADSPPPYFSSPDHQDLAENRKWRSSLNGHVKSDSGFNEYGMDNLQYSDI